MTPIWFGPKCHPNKIIICRSSRCDQWLLMIIRRKRECSTCDQDSWFRMSPCVFEFGYLLFPMKELRPKEQLEIAELPTDETKHRNRTRYTSLTLLIVDIRLIHELWILWWYYHHWHPNDMISKEKKSMQHMSPNLPDWPFRLLMSTSSAVLLNGTHWAVLIWATFTNTLERCLTERLCVMTSSEPYLICKCMALRWHWICRLNLLNFNVTFSILPFCWWLTSSLCVLPLKRSASLHLYSADGLQALAWRLVVHLKAIHFVFSLSILVIQSTCYQLASIAPNLEVPMWCVAIWRIIIQILGQQIKLISQLFDF